MWVELWLKVSGEVNTWSSSTATSVCKHDANTGSNLPCLVTLVCRLNDTWVKCAESTRCFSRIPCWPHDTSVECVEFTIFAESGSNQHGCWIPCQSHAINAAGCAEFATCAKSEFATCAKSLRHRQADVSCPSKGNDKSVRLGAWARILLQETCSLHNESFRWILHYDQHIPRRVH